MGEVLEHRDLADKVLRNLARGEDGALAQLRIVVDGSGERREEGRTSAAALGIISRLNFPFVSCKPRIHYTTDPEQPSKRFHILAHAWTSRRPFASGD